MKRIDITGNKYGRLLVLRYAYTNNKGKACYECLCDCGNKKIVIGENLKSGASTSCGCYNIERSKEVNSKHRYKENETKTRLYNEWLGIKKRCNYKKSKDHDDYGARGIKVCKEWENNYIAFKEWALKNGYNDNLTIERIDVNKGYSPDNCKWIELAEQAFNKRTPKNNNTGVRGVSYVKNKYVVRIGYKGKRYYVGAYDTIEEAKIKREKFEKNLWRR